MNFQQLEYIIALDRHRNFVRASEASFVTQPTLSAMVLKLEEELGVRIFDRSKQPIVPTSEGVMVLNYARDIIDKASELKESLLRFNDDPVGDFRIGVIPTVASSLLPVFLSGFLKSYPSINLIVSELTTATIIDKLGRDELDAGIIATPVESVKLTEYPVYREEFMLYGREAGFSEGLVSIDDIDLSRLWLLEEGHCLRMQVVNLCDMRGGNKLHPNLQYQAGSLESLRRLVDSNGGYTVLPALSTIDLTDNQRKNLRRFEPPVPARQISVVSMRTWKCRRHIELMAAAISGAVGSLGLSTNSNLEVVPVSGLKMDTFKRT